MWRLWLRVSKKCLGNEAVIIDIHDPGHAQEDAVGMSQTQPVNSDLMTSDVVRN